MVAQVHVKSRLVVLMSALTLHHAVFSVSKLRGEWEERVKVIGSLEESLVQVQETFSQREAALNRDRDQATQRARCLGGWVGLSLSQDCSTHTLETLS